MPCTPGHGEMFTQCSIGALWLVSVSYQSYHSCLKQHHVAQLNTFSFDFNDVLLLFMLIEQQRPIHYFSIGVVFMLVLDNLCILCN